jgi:hypothetical protein
MVTLAKFQQKVAAVYYPLGGGEPEDAFAEPSCPCPHQKDCCKHLIPHMLRQKKGAIVNLASINSFIGMEMEGVSTFA